MAKINWTDQALDDLTHIAEYIAQDSERYAKVTLGRIRERVKALRLHPQLGRIVPEVGSPALRELIMGNYRIIYVLTETGTADILTVHHSAKRLSLGNLDQDHTEETF